MYTSADQKWSYINLADFRSSSCFPPFAYGYLWFSLFISIAVYGVDTFTAVSLLAFDEWAGAIEPKVKLSISKWVFSACIIASFVNLGFEYIRAWRVMKRGNVAECYLDSLAVRLESIRMGRGQGWRRFLVFTELTKSKKGAEYIALFTYFSFQSWIRVLVCSGPRQVINALTLYALYDSNLADKEASSVDGSIMGAFKNFGSLATENYQQALVMAGMAFTFVVWAFSLVFLIFAIFFYLVFLWHWIPRADGGLAGYCERKVNKALVKIVTKKVNKAIQREETEKFKAEQKMAKKAGEKAPLERQATLPTIPSVAGVDGDKLPEMPTLVRTDTISTLPPYASRPGTPGSFELSSMDQKRPFPTRTGTMSSSTTYSSRAPLVAGASDMGNSPLSPAASVPSVDLASYPPMRPGTAASNRSFSRPNPSLGHMPTNSSSSLAANRRPSDPNFFGPSRYTETPANAGDNMPFPTPVRSPTTSSVGGYNRPPMPQIGMSRPPPMSRTQYDSFSGSDGRASPAPSAYSTRSGPGLPRNPASGSMNSPGPYQAYQPNRSATNPLPPRGPQTPTMRNMTAPVPPRQPTGNYIGHQQQGSQGSYNHYDYDYDREGRRDRRY